jgi:hypothetical protein
MPGDIKHLSRAQNRVQELRVHGIRVTRHVQRKNIDWAVDRYIFK